ncbi:MAG: ribbon-helix-helix domain-containing protein [Arcobacteraceae bacterium]|jgi:hypothetical protein|nr:ribbon-helix-helix domain-containing protein [Arcobacteraceae bacterium]
MAERLSIKDVLNKGKESVITTYADADKKKGGRPKKDTNETKKNKITIYLDDNELETLTKAANEVGLSVGLFIKTSAIKTVKKDILN